MRLFKPVIGCLFLISGCAWIPEGDKPAEFMTAPSMDHALSEFHEKQATASLERWPNERWWQEFGSSELNSLMANGLKDNPGLKAASDRVREAEALARVEGSRLLPFIDADADVAYERVSAHGLFAALNRKEAAGAHIVASKINLLNFRYEFDFWGKNRAALEASLGEAAADKAEMADTLLRLTTAIARSYFRGVALRHQLDLATEMVKLRQDLLDISETRLRLGLDSVDPVKESSINLEQARKREALTRDQLDLQRNLLAKLIGKGPDSTQHLFLDKVNIPRDLALPDKLPLELLRHRPDLTSALFRAEAAAQRIKEAKARFLPTIDLTAFAGVNALRLTKGASTLANVLFSGSSVAYGVAPGLRLPLFEGGRLRAELSAQRAEYDKSVELYNDTLLHAIQEVADSLSGWKESLSILEAHGRLMSSQRKNQELAEDRVRAGLDDRRELLDRRHAVLEQEYVLKTLETDHLAARVDLIESLGGGYSKEIEIIQQLIRHKPEHPEGFDLYKWLIFSQKE
ncbi:efflux transporter outer membrane subunit [Methylosarcina fibrata]|uniref:efflux transporter outer membrane subunit n=1 Tax=Methylosarcina fibrata TaxID=105972 RepID=UPI00035DABB5|nr:efflux transporter outer membrane subunit [Methylosarcina fibrata]